MVNDVLRVEKLNVRVAETARLLEILQAEGARL